MLTSSVAKQIWIEILRMARPQATKTNNPRLGGDYSEAAVKSSEQRIDESKKAAGVAAFGNEKPETETNY
jgi:hypothetical protein